MPVSISIEPLSPSIDMYDSPDTSSAYSLSGHIAVTLTPSSSILGLSRPPSQNLLLTSLELTFEGQSELILTDVGYAPLRLVTITKQLVSPSHPVHISADEDRAEWRVVFDLSVPGWLPATSVFGDDDEQDAAGVNYALYAHARFQAASADPDDAASLAASTSTSSVWNNLCSVVRLGSGRPRSVNAEKVPIRLTRYVSPPSHGDDALPPVFSRAAFAIQALPESASGSSTNIPEDILRSVQLHAIVPSRTLVEDDSVSLALRLRSRSDNEDTRNRLRVLGFEADIVQVETYHTSPASSYAARYPIPPVEQQPPAKPLRSTHPIGTLFELGMVCSPPDGKQVVRERSIIPDGVSKTFKVRGTDSTESGVRFEDGWLRMEASVPVSPGLEDRNEKGKRVAGESPFFDVSHEMRVRLTVGYEQPGEGSTTLSDELAFVVPLEFVLVTPPTISPFASTFFPAPLHGQAHSTSSLPLPHPPMSSSTRAPSRTHSLSSLLTDAHARSTSSLSSIPPLPTPPPLPAYSQLFHENGDMKEEFLSALPVYREKEDMPGHSPSASTSSAVSSTSTSSLNSCSTSPPYLAPLPQLASLTSPPESPISPGMPLTPPPGLGSCRASRKSKRDHKFGESFLKLDEDESELEIAEDIPERDGAFENEADLGLGDVQYGIAY